MKQEIIRSEYEPEKKFLWLHTKDGNLVLEAYGNQGWESVGNDILNSQALKPIKITLPNLTEKCSKKELLAAVNTLTEVLVTANIIEL